MNHKQYQFLIGKNRDQIKDELGEEFNYYPAMIWSYLLKKNWLGRKTVLLLYFKNDLVYKINIRQYYAKIIY